MRATSSPKFEGGRQVVDLSIPRSQRPQVPAALDEGKHRGGVVDRVIHVMLLRKRRDDDRGNSSAGSPAIDFRRRNVIPSAAVFVVNDEDRRLRPIRTLTHQL